MSAPIQGKVVASRIISTKILESTNPNEEIIEEEIEEIIEEIEQTDWINFCLFSISYFSIGYMTGIMFP